MSNTENFELDCSNCEFRKAVYSKTLHTFVNACTRWDCIYEEEDDESLDSEGYET